MDLFIVGGTGLISTGITRRAVAAGHDVTVFTRGERDADLPDSVTHERGDRTDTERLASAVTGADPDALVDMVCFTPEEAHEALRAAADVVDQYVFCSTVDVYHRPPERNPVTESASRHPGVSEYGRQKAAAEDVFFAAHDRGDVEVTVIRPWSTYGEGGPVLHTLGVGTYYVDRIRKGKPIVVHGDGTSLWGPCHRDDVARAFVAALGNEDAYGEAYHVTSEETITWNQYHHRVARALDAPEPDLVHVPTDVLTDLLPDRTAMLRDHFQFSTVFDNAKARRDLDFAYTVPFEEGVERTVAWLDAHGEVDPWDAEADDRLVAAWRDATDEVRERFDPPSSA